MQEIQIKRVRQGVWIDNEWLQKAGLGDRLEIELKENEILIRSADKVGNPNAASSESGWDVFRKLGDDAVDGYLENASENHDRYLYGKKE
jgi:hypothetical protein